MLKLTRKQELALIDLGLAAVIDRVFKTHIEPKPKSKPAETPKPAKKNGRKWTPAQRRKFKASMKKVWKKKQANLK